MMSAMPDDRYATEPTAPETELEALRRAVSVTQAATLLGVSRPTIYAMVARGELTMEHIAGNPVVLHDEKYLEAEIRRRG